MPKPRKTKAANIANVANKPTPQTQLAIWLRAMADKADEGLIPGFAAAVIGAGAPSPFTFVHDPNDANARMILNGTLSQLSFMLNHTEHQLRMASLAARPDITPPAA